MRGLVFSGGGARGAVGVGVLKKIVSMDPDRTYDLFSGVSVGAINATFLASFLEMSEGIAKLEEIWGQISNKKVYRRFVPWPPNASWLGPFRVFFQTGIYDTGPLLKLLQENLDVEALKKNGKMLRIGAANKRTGLYTEVTEKECQLPLWVLASAAYPLAFKAVKIGKELYTDGGLVNMTPLAGAIRAGCTEIDVILTGPLHNILEKETTEFRNIFEAGYRALDIAFGEVWKNDFKVCHKVNESVKKGDPEKPYHKEVKVRVFAPEKPLVYSSLKFDPQVHKELINLGETFEAVDLKTFLGK